MKEVATPLPSPSKFRDDVVHVARNCEPGVLIEQIAKDCGVKPPMTPQKWLHCAHMDKSGRLGRSRTEAGEVRELRKRNRLLEQENEVLRRAATYLSQTNLSRESSPRS